MKPRVYGFLLLAIVSLAACGGGGGSSSGGGGVAPSAPAAGTTTLGATPAPTAPPSPTPTPTAAALAVSGTAVDLTSGAPLAGFTVTVGQVPNSATCLASQTATTQPCGVPASPQPTATTSATGAFSVSVPSPGTYMLTIGKDGTYATLHRTVSVAAGVTTPGSVKITALTSDEQSWLADVNHQRATVSVPASFPNLIVDEYAEEQARQWAIDVTSGKTAYGDGGYGSYQSTYSNSPGALYGAAGVLDEIGSAATPPLYLIADTAWTSERLNCPGEDWQTCAFANNTGHYINLSNTDTVWIGLGESATATQSQYSYYNLMLIENAKAVGPALALRALIK